MNTYAKKTRWFSGEQSHSGPVYTGPYIESYSFGSHATKTAEVARVVCAQINALHDNVWAILFCYLKKKTQEILRIYIHCLIKTKGGGGGSLIGANHHLILFLSFFLTIHYIWLVLSSTKRDVIQFEVYIRSGFMHFAHLCLRVDSYHLWDEI